MPKLGDIRKIVSAKYRFDVGWGYLEKWLEDAEKIRAWSFARTSSEGMSGRTNSGLGMWNGV